MLLVPTFLAPSSIHGIGVFAEVAIDKGTTVYVFNPILDKMFTASEKQKLPAYAQEWVDDHAFLTSSNLWIIAADNDNYSNHSSTPNLVEVPSSEPKITLDLVAATDIPAGTELTQDYFGWNFNPKVAHLKYLNRINM